MRQTSIVALACIAMCVASCGRPIKRTTAAQVAVCHFHQLYNEGQFDTIWSEAHPRFRNASHKAKYDEFMSGVYQTLGKTVSTSNNAWRMNIYNGVTTITVSQKTLFERGEGMESFSFQMIEENAVLIGYHIQSMDLIRR